VAEQLYATLKTNHGDIEIRLFPDHAPKTVRNFVELAKGEREWVHPATGKKSTDRLYDGTVFHPELSFNKPYLLAMANAGPGTNGSQFFITVAPTTWLTGKHTIFGEVANEAGKKVVDAIAATQTNPRTDRPVKDVVIETVEIESRKA
jgi:peptidyl-prolyl cis-trans isomerase A (cyclophilin A)